MNLKHSSLCVGLIVTSVLAFSATPSKAVLYEPKSVYDEFNFLTGKNIEKCDTFKVTLLTPTSCETTGSVAPNNSIDGSMTSGFKISSVGGGLKRGTDKGLGIGDEGLIDSVFGESITFTIPTLGSKLGTLKLLQVGSFIAGYESFRIEGFKPNNTIEQKEFKLSSLGEGDLIDFKGSTRVRITPLITTKSLFNKTTPIESNLSLMSARAEIVTMVAVPVPEPTPTAGMLGLLAGWLAYKGISRLAKRDEPELLK